MTADAAMVTKKRLRTLNAGPEGRKNHAKDGKRKNALKV